MGEPRARRVYAHARRVGHARRLRSKKHRGAERRLLFASFRLSVRSRRGNRLMQFIAPYRLIGSPKIGLHLHPDHVSDLRASGLTDETMRAAGVYSLRPCDFARFFSPRGIPNEIETALCFPY